MEIFTFNRNIWSFSQNLFAKRRVPREMGKGNLKNGMPSRNSQEFRSLECRQDKRCWVFAWTMQTKRSLCRGSHSTSLWYTRGELV